MSDDETPDDTVEGPSEATGATVSDLHARLRGGPLYVVPGPENDPDGPGVDDVTFDDLCFIARRLMRTALAEIDWSGLSGYAEGMVPPEDVSTVVKLMQNADIEIYLGGE